jgi:hypothetical protein
MGVDIIPMILLSYKLEKVESRGEGKSGKAWLEAALNSFKAAPTFLIPDPPSRVSGTFFKLLPKWVQGF